MSVFVRWGAGSHTNLPLGSLCAEARLIVAKLNNVYAVEVTLIDVTKTVLDDSTPCPQIITATIEKKAHFTDEEWATIILAHGKGYDKAGVKRALTKAPESATKLALMEAARHGVDELVVLMKGKKLTTSKLNFNHVCLVEVDDAVVEATPLIMAARNAHENMITLLLDSHADVNSQPPKQKETALIFAAQQGHLDIVKMLLDARALPNLSNSRGNSALGVSASFGRRRVVARLLQANADVNAPQSRRQESSLHLAGESGHEVVLRLLLQHRADLNAETTSLETPLYWAAERNHADAVELLLREGASANVLSKENRSPFSQAVRNGNAQCVKCLLEYAPDLEAEYGLNKRPALFMASLLTDPAVAQLLIAARAKVNRPAFDGATALFIAAENGSTEVISLLVQNKANPDAKTAVGITPLMRACQRLQFEAAETLLECKANVNMRVADNMTSVSYIATYFDWSSEKECVLDATAQGTRKPRKRKLTGITVASKPVEDLGQSTIFAQPSAPKGTPELLSFIERLIESKSDVKGQNGFEVLGIASQLGKERLVKVLIQANADLNACGPDGSTLLVRKIALKDACAIGCLVNHLADINLRDKSDVSPLVHACDVTTEESDDILALLLNNKMTTIDSQDKEGRTVLHYAAFKDICIAIKEILHKTTHVNVQCRIGRTPLMESAIAASSKCARTLLYHGADALIVDNDSNTALHIACINGNHGVADVLLEVYRANKFDVDKKGKGGGTALLVAARSEQTEIVRKLLAEKANVDEPDDSDITALSWAKENNKSMLQILNRPATKKLGLFSCLRR
eukprot:GEMP01014790.1.p1 GENE.GEMP01014790.1~~GEMP01014790.1.p1  ORF type:complete len:807 (+),score=202.92 GEMP01014790.1:355-2775(+)